MVNTVLTTTNPPFDKSPLSRAFSLRWYQSESISAIWQYFIDGNKGNPLVELPTGAGKSIVIAEFIRQVFEKFRNQKIIIATHSMELVEQNAKKLLEIWPSAPMGIYSAGLNRKETSRPITYVGIDSVSKHAAKFGKVDMVIVDEAHMCDDKEGSRYRQFFDELRNLEIEGKQVNRNLKIVGLTATPWRAGLGHLTNGEIFTDVCYSAITPAAFERLFNEGFLCPLFPVKTDLQLDVSEVHMRGQEFIESELQKAVDKTEITNAALDEVISKASHCNKWLCFATGIQHAEHIVEALEARGVSCRIVTGESKRKNERVENIKAFKTGEFKCLVNVGVLTTGFDCPDIDLIIMLRPTGSTVLWCQMLGRGLRPHSSKNFTLVMDFGGNTDRLGPIDDPIIPKRKGEGGGGPPPVKTCPQCKVQCHTRLDFCPCCGYKYPEHTKLTPEASQGKLLRGTETEDPIFENFKVDYVSYELHKKRGKPDSVKVSYTCGMRTFTEYVCPEHETARGLAAKWWKIRGGGELPKTTMECLDVISGRTIANHIQVHVNGKYPSIKKHDFTGSNFGADLNAEPVQVPVIQGTGLLQVDNYVDEFDEM